MTAAVRFGMRGLALFLLGQCGACSPPAHPDRFQDAVRAVDRGLDTSIVAFRVGGVTDHDLATLGPTDGLRCLVLDGSTITDQGMTEVSRLHGLETLSLSDTRVTDEGLRPLAGLKKLRHLRLDRLPVTDAGLAHLAGLAELRTLSLWKARVDDGGVPHLAGLRRLVVLSLDDTTVSGDGVIELVRALPDLRYLSVANTGVSPEAVGAVQKANARIVLNR